MDRVNKFQYCSILRDPDASGSMIRNRARRDAAGGEAQAEPNLQIGHRTGGMMGVGSAVETSKKHKGQRNPIAEKHGGIAQLGEHLLCKQGVKGSNPFISTIWADSSAG